MQNRITDFLFKNAGIRQTIFKNTFWLVLTEVVSRLVGLFLIIYIIRLLGAAEYGKFSFAMSFASVMSIIAGLGIIEIATREFSKNRQNEQHFNGILTLQVILCVLALAATVVGSFFITADVAVRQMIWMLSVFLLSSNVFGIIFSLLRARQKMETEAFIRILQTLVNAAAAFFVIFFTPSVQHLSFGYMVSNLVVIAGVLLVFHLVFVRLSWVWERSSLDILAISWPLSLGFTSEWLLILINSVMLGFFGLNDQNGWYSASAKIAVAAIVPADLILKSFYPALSNFFANSPQTFQKAWDQFAQLMVFLTVGTIIGGWEMAPGIITFFYGPDFTPSILVFRLLVVVIGISFLSYPYAIALVIANQQRKNFILVLAAAVLNILLDLVLIPRYGLYGAAVATVISSLLVLVLMIALFKKKIGFNPLDKKLWSALVVSLLCGILMHGILSLPIVASGNVLVACTLGAVVYGGSIGVIYKYIWKTL